MLHRKYNLVSNKQLINQNLLGGNNEYVLINFVYFKTLNTINTIKYEEWTDIYIVDENYNAYRMAIGIIDSMYVLALVLPKNKIFKFKFMKNTFIEFLDNDIDLLSYHYNKNNSINQKDLNDLTRWRYIYTSEDVDKKIMCYSYCMPNFNINNTNTIIDLLTINSNRRDLLEINDEILNNTIIQDKREIYIYDSYGGKQISKIEIPKIELNKNDNNVFYELIRHNMGYNIEIPHKNFSFELNGNIYDNITSIYNFYRNNGCRVENIYIYFREYIRKDIEIIMTALKAIEYKSKYIGMLNYKDLNIIDPIFISSYSNRISNTDDTKKLHGDPSIIYSSNELYNYYTKQICYAIHPNPGNSVDLDTNIGELYIKIKLKDNIIKMNALTNKIDELLTHIITLSRILLGKFGNMPNTVANYISFFKQFKLVSLKYLMRLQIIEILSDLQKYIINDDNSIELTDNTTSTTHYINQKNLTIGATITYTSITTTANDTLLTQKINKIMNDLSGKYIYSWINDNTIKQYFNDINIDNLLTLKWLDENIFSIYTEYSTKKDPITKLLYNTLCDATTLAVLKNENINGIYITKGPIQELNEIIKINTGPNQLYKFVNELLIYTDEYKDQNNKNIILRDDSNKFKLIDKSLGIDIHSSISDNILSYLSGQRNTYKEDYKMTPIFNLNNSNITLYNKLCNNSDNNIDKIVCIDNTSSLILLLKKNIELIHRGFWLRLDDITIYEFISSNSFSSENIAKLYIKLLFITNYCRSNEGIKLKNIIQNISSKPAIKMPSFNYYDFINNDKLFDKLLKLSIYNHQAGYFNIEIDPIFTNNEEVDKVAPFFNSLFKSTIEISTKMSIMNDLFCPDNVDKLFLYDDKNATIEIVLTNIMTNIKDPIIIKNINMIYNNTKSIALNIIPVSPLLY